LSETCPFREERGCCHGKRRLFAFFGIGDGPKAGTSAGIRHAWLEGSKEFSMVRTEHAYLQSESHMKKLLGMSVLALFAAAEAAQPADAGVNVSVGFGIGGNFSIQRDGYGHHGYGWHPRRALRRQYIAAFPDFGHQYSEPHHAFPPPGDDRPGPRGDRKEDEAVQWGYPNLNYSYYHPVSHHRAQQQAEHYPTGYYNPPPYYYPPNYGTPGYYPSQGITFDR
jgi:hypothetical protein